MPILPFTLLQCFLVLIPVLQKDSLSSQLWKKLLTFTVYSGCYIWGETVLTNSYIIDMVFLMLLSCGFFCLAASEPLDHALLLGILFSISMETGKVIVYGTLATTPLMKYIQQSVLWHCVSRMGIIAIRAGLLFIVRYFYHSLEDERIHPGVFLYMLLPFLTLVCVRILILPTYSDSYHKFQYDQAAILFFLSLSVIGTAGSALFSVTASLRQHKLERIEQVIQLQYRIAAEQERSNAEIARMNHDMKNQLIGLSSMVDTPEGQAHLERLRRQLDASTIQTYTQDGILNALLNEKVRVGEEQDIHIQIFMETAPDSDITTEDLCSIFGNLLDNAMEAVSKLPEEKRFITLKAALMGNYWIMKITNPYEGELKLKSGHFLTTKKDADSHGIGLSSVKLSVSHYNGEILCDNTDGLFVVTVMLPQHHTSS